MYQKFTIIDKNDGTETNVHIKENSVLVLNDTTEDSVSIIAKLRACGIEAAVIDVNEDMMIKINE